MTDKNSKFKIMKYHYFFVSLIILLCIPFISLAQEEERAYTIKEYLEESLPPQERRSITLNEATGLLTVRDTPSNHKLIEAIIKMWDVGPKQIAIEARFVEVSLTNSDQLGIEWQGEYQYRNNGRRAARGKGDLYVGSGPTGNPGGGSAPDYSGTNFGLGDAGIGGGLGLYLGKTKLNGNQLYATLRALEHSKKATMLSSPKITTLQGQEANIQIITRNPYVTSVERTKITEGGDLNKTYKWEETYNIAEKVTGIELVVKPTVGAEDVITLNISPKVSFVKARVAVSSNAPTGLGWPIIDTRSAQTSVIVKSGETVVLGGLIKDDESVTVKKVPFLGSLPILGKMFRSESKSREKKNLIIFLTATLISPEGRAVQ